MPETIDTLAGYIGFTVETRRGEHDGFIIGDGYNGFAIEINRSQFIEGASGYKGFSVEIELRRHAKIIRRR